jgi:hypothetical protein
MKKHLFSGSAASLGLAVVSFAFVVPAVWAQATDGSAAKSRAANSASAPQSAKSVKSVKSVKAVKSSRPPAAQNQSASRVEIRSTASQMAAGIAAAEAALDPIELAIAEQVHTGVMPCELGASVTLASDPASPGYFTLQGKNFRFRMVPVVSATGAIRLEDQSAGAVWLQLANKSMLMNQKAGKRMADECMSPAQFIVAQAMKDKPGPGLLDAPEKPVPAPLELASQAGENR